MDDLISRQDIEWYDYLVADGNGMYHNEQVAYRSQIDALPSAQPERKTGKWIEHKDYPNLAFLCSECGYFTTMRTYNFCPNCGSDMRGEEHED